MPQDFVSLFCELTKNFESPANFWKWSAYGAIAATLRYNCYLKWGTSNLYPNMYILLLADSAAYRKDAGPELIEELLRECAHTKVISGRASWQGIVDELSQDIGNKKTGVPIKGGAGIVIALEFTAMFVEDPNLIKLMTEGYAFAPEYEYTLRGGKTKIKNRCISILAGSNETLLKDFYTMQASYGGLLRRTCLIKPDKRRPPNALMETTDHLADVDKKKLVDFLKEIQKLKGEFKFLQKAKDVYIAWYKDLYNNYDKIVDKSGFVAGMHALIAKLAMVLAAAENTLEISEDIIQKAIKEIIDLKGNYTTYIMGAGKNPHADISAVILTTMWQQACNGNHKLKRREMLFKFWNEISAEDLDKIIQTLQGAGLIQMTPVGMEPAYELTNLAKNIFLKDEKSKSQGIN
jgi:hypothetical protein